LSLGTVSLLVKTNVDKTLIGILEILGIMFTIDSLMSKVKSAGLMGIGLAEGRRGSFVRMRPNSQHDGGDDQTRFTV